MAAVHSEPGAACVRIPVFWQADNDDGVGFDQALPPEIVVVELLPIANLTLVIRTSVGCDNLPRAKDRGDSRSCQIPQWRACELVSCGVLEWKVCRWVVQVVTLLASPLWHQ